MTCSQPSCPIETSGRCLEGFDPPSTCPYFAGSDQGQEESASYDPQELVDLPSGEALTEWQAAEVTRDNLTKVIIIAGPTGSGKTTILTSLFEAFLEAPFANYLFRGSRTLVGFERRCHLGREESGFGSADTTHTSVREGIVFLHLDLATFEDSELRHGHLLLSDISGELFKRLRDSGDAIRAFPSFRRANHLCLALDGEKIASREQRHVARNDSRSMLRSIIESGALDSDSVIDVAFTKWDVIVAAMEADSLQANDIGAFIDDTKSALRKTAGDFEIVFHEVAARPPKDAKIPFAHGLPTLLRSWMGHNRSLTQRESIFLGNAQSREFSRYTEAVIFSKRLEGQYVIHRL
jgi:hypothetical protein